MAQQFLVTTSGTQTPVVLDDLGARSIPHPVSNLDLLLEFSMEELRRSADVQNAISAGYITVVDENAQPITNVAAQQAGVTQETFDTHVDDTGNPHSVTPTQIGAAVVTSTAPVNVTRAAASVGSSSEAARQDHKHDVSTAAAVSTGSANAEGTATSLSRSDHTHAVTEVLDSLFRVINSGDPTKKAAFDLSGLTTSILRTMTVPDKDFTLNLVDGMDTADMTDGHVQHVLTPDGSGGVDFVPSKSAYDAVCANDGTADYTSIAAAFAAGNQKVFVHVGTYVETADIVLPNGGDLHCEEGTIITFNGGAYSLKVDGSGGSVETAGTVAATYGSAVITGTSTTFTNLSPGDVITVDGIILLPIVSIASDTQLTVQGPWLGPSASGLSYIAETTHRFRLSGFLVTGSTTAGISIRAGSSAVIYKALAMGNATNLKIEDSASIIVNSSAFYGSTSGYNVELSRSSSIVFDTCALIGGASGGIYLSNCNTTGLNKIFSALNNGCGIDVGTGCVGTVISGTNVRRNNTRGAYFDSASDKTSITDLISLNNGQEGVYLAGTSTACASAVVVGNGGIGVHCGPDSTFVNGKVRDNGGAGISIKGDSCVVSLNEVVGNGGNGIEAPQSGDSNYSVILGNRVSDNDGDGLYIANGNTANKVGVNYIDNHTADVNILDVTTIIVMENLVDDLTPQLGGDLDAQNQSIYAIKRASFNSEYTIGSVSGTLNVDWSNGNVQTVTLTGNVATINFSNAAPGRYSLRVLQGGSGGYSLTGWSSVKWRQAQTPDLSSGATGDEYIFTFEYRGASAGYYGDADLWG